MIPYIINVGLVLAICLAFYKILLRKETFYKVNRYVLVLCLLASFALPLWRVPQKISFRKTSAPAIQYNPGLIAVDPADTKKPGQTAQQSATTPTTPQQTVQQPVVQQETKQSSSNAGFSFSQLMTWLIWIYWFGVIIFGLNFLFQAALLLWRAYRNPVIVDGRYRIVEVSGDKAPCSFGNNIFINPEKYEWDTYNQILLHEKVHIRDRHSLDILFSEIVLIFQWFNPFAWIYRREVESNLEYLTDDQLMQKHKVEKTSYQLSLLKVSAPHFPLSITTNYNQSILKKRIAMMNSKRSNFHTAWKYFFLLPVLALFACLLNEPKAQTNNISKTEEKEKKKDKEYRSSNINTEGFWFATIKDDKINIQFKSDDDGENGHSFNGSTYKLSEIVGNLPKDASGTFKLIREAGTMEMTGRFEGSTGMGHYKFIVDKTYSDYMSKELVEKMEDNDVMVFFFIDIKKDYVQMLKSQGYSGFDKDQLIPLAALHIDKPYITSLRESGFKDLTLEDLIPLKSLGVDAAYIKEIRSAGYENITADQLVTFKAQGIDKEYIGKVRNLRTNEPNKNGKHDDADDIVTFKSLGITDEYINSFKPLGYTNIDNDALVAMKSMGITPAYIKSWQDAGYKKLDIEEELIPLKAQDITPGYVKTWQDLGYKDISIREEIIPLKSQDITPEFIKSFESVGFKNIPIDEIIAVKAVGVTPQYISSMKEKGFNYDRIQKYVTLKSIE